MIKKLFNVVKKIIISVLLIYAYNKMSLSMNLFIPMNFFTILLISCCGIPAIIMLVMFSLICI